MYLIVFDLDFTLWNAAGTWCDHTLPPYKKVKEHVIDSRGGVIALYPEVRSLLDMLVQKGFTLAVASRTHEPSWARTLMDLLEISKYFSHCEIFPGSKIAHFEKLRAATGIDYGDIFFFDDEHRNVEEVASLGVTTYHVESGMTMKLLGEVLVKCE